MMHSQKKLIGISAIMHTIIDNHFFIFYQICSTIISDLCCIHHISIPPCIFLIISYCMFSSNIFNLFLKLPHSFNYGAFLGVYK
jgi:hypothetical protein